MKLHKKDAQETVDIMDLDVVDLILIDHRFMKECIAIITDEKADKRKKLASAKELFSVFEHHADLERKSVYEPLKNHEEFHFNLLEAEKEHSNILKKIKYLKAKTQRVRTLKAELEAELKTFAEMMMSHLIDEESDFFPRMREEIDDESLRMMGKHFMSQRRFSNAEIMNYPQLYDELIRWKDSIQKVSSKFLMNRDKSVEDMERH